MIGGLPTEFQKIASLLHEGFGVKWDGVGQSTNRDGYDFFHNQKMHICLIMFHCKDAVVL